MTEKLWFSKPIDNVLEELKVNSDSGLTDNEAQTRLEQYGANKLQAAKKKSVLQLFLAQLNDWLIYVLFAAVLITSIMGEYVDAIIILLVIFINAALGVFQEVKAGKAIEALQKMSSPRALVKRNGQVKEIEAEVLVPGDVVVLEAGRYIPADLRLIESANLQIEESALTGESVPSEKDANSVFEDNSTPLGDRINSAFMSTLVTYGRGVGVVTETGMNTEVGKIAHILESNEGGKTPLEKRLDDLGKMLGKIAIGICLLIFGVSLIQGRDIGEMFLISVSLAVASIPEGLAAIVAVVLSIGVTSMSKRNAIIKRLPAVETLGSVNVICSDKTGTLTQNKMTVVKAFTLEGEADIKDDENDVNESIKLLAKAMILDSDATLENGESTGDPTEIALLALGDKIGINRNELKNNTKRINEYAFDSDRKLMSVLVEENGEHIVYTKGALGSIKEISTHVYDNGNIVPITEEYKNKFSDAAHSMSDNALRTLAVAFKKADAGIQPENMEKDLVLIGVVGMIDPPRHEVKDSIAIAKNAGIKTVMITGDHKNTAFAIAKDLGITDNSEQAVDGKYIDTLSEDELNQKISNYRVFARVSPEHKVKIVKGLKANGNIVSMTGDGVNDAPSLHSADIGVAMGITGTDVAKGASDMILTDDNFSTIVSAVEQGRNIYNNIKKSVVFLLTCNLGEVVTMFVCLIIGWASPLLATQLLWINLVTDSLPAVGLGMDPGDPDIMKDKPRPPKETFFTKITNWQIALGGLVIGLITAFAFWYGHYHHGYNPFDKNIPESVLEYAHTMAFMVLVFAQLFYSLSVRSHYKSIFKIGLFSNKYLIGAVVIGILLQLIVLFIPVLKDAFKLQMLERDGWLMAIGLSLIPLFLSEIAKLFRKQTA